MKKTLIFSMTTAAGAGTYAMTLISEDGTVKNQAAFTAPKDMAITRIIPMGANGSYSTMARSAHQADNSVFDHPADTLADHTKTIDFMELMGQGIEISANEQLTFTTTVTGNATISLGVELDDTVKKTNARCIRAAGVNAAVALTPTESGGNVATNMNPIAKYRLRAARITSTSIQHVELKLGTNTILVPGVNAILTGQGFVKLSDDQASVMTGFGAEWQSTFNAWLTCTAADAANVQFLNMLFESS